MLLGGLVNVVFYVISLALSAFSCCGFLYGACLMLKIENKKKNKSYLLDKVVDAKLA